MSNNNNNITFKDIPNSNYQEVFKDGIAVAQIEKGNKRMYDHVMKQVLCDHSKYGLEYGLIFMDDTQINCTNCRLTLYWVSSDLHRCYTSGYKQNGKFVTVKDDPRLKGLVFN